mmetsp:Transcript_19437/g.40008  ORF Transcript_19437/g.40008 Transcript_19437/m.40008 type:complete len:450 (-) Transcript_19437:459-1808(-)
MTHFSEQSSDRVSPWTASSDPSVSTLESRLALPFFFLESLEESAAVFSAESLLPVLFTKTALLFFFLSTLGFFPSGDESSAKTFLLLTPSWCLGVLVFFFLAVLDDFTSVSSTRANTLGLLSPSLEETLSFFFLDDLGVGFFSAALDFPSWKSFSLLPWFVLGVRRSLVLSSWFSEAAATLPLFFFFFLSLDLGVGGSSGSARLLLLSSVSSALPVMPMPLVLFFFFFLVLLLVYVVVWSRSCAVLLFFRLFGEEGFFFPSLAAALAAESVAEVALSSALVVMLIDKGYRRISRSESSPLPLLANCSCCPLVVQSGAVRLVRSSLLVVAALLTLPGSVRVVRSILTRLPCWCLMVTLSNNKFSFLASLIFFHHSSSLVSTWTFFFQDFSSSFCCSSFFSESFLLSRLNINLESSWWWWSSWSVSRPSCCLLGCFFSLLRLLRKPPPPPT